MSLRQFICLGLFVNMSLCPFMLALNVGQRRVAERNLNSRCPHLVGVRDRLPGSLRACAHPEIRHSIARSLSRDGHVVFTNTNLPDASHLHSRSVPLSLYLRTIDAGQWSP